MANSFVNLKTVQITADTVALDADGISVATSVGNNAALVIGGALASGGAVVLKHGRIVTILSAGNDAAKSFTVTGTDINGAAQTESITGANAGTATGTKFFLTISGISAVGNPAGNVSAGVNATAADVIVISAARLDPAVIAAITERINDAIDARNVMVDDLQYEVARVTKAYNDVIRTYGSKLMEFGIPPEEVELRPLPTQTSTLPAGLVAAR